MKRRKKKGPRWLRVMKKRGKWLCRMVPIYKNRKKIGTAVNGLGFLLSALPKKN